MAGAEVEWSKAPDGTWWSRSGDEEWKRWVPSQPVAAVASATPALPAMSSAWGITAPTSPPSVPVQASGGFGDQTLVGNEISGWAVAGGPLLGLAVSAVIAAVAGVGAAVTAGWVVYIGLNSLLTWWDADVQKRRGVTGVPWRWAILLMPVYLYMRQKHLVRTQVLLGVWILTFILSVTLQSSVLDSAASHGSLALNASKLEAQIQAGTATASGLDTGRVSCPSENSLHQGMIFQCIFTAYSDGSTTLIDVTVENNSGDVIWQVAP